ncbi:hypothetical protein AAG906_002792 [Vitis piasezkii]
MLNKESRPTNVIKPKLEWDRGGNEASENNARVIYSIFNAISTDEFYRIATLSKLQMLTSRFETIMMEDHEKFGEFHAKLMDIMNSSFNLGEPIPNFKRFRAKVTTIEESKDVDSLKVDELVGSLQTFEMALESPRKSKSLPQMPLKMSP